MVDAFVSGLGLRRSGAWRCCASLGFIVLLTLAFWAGALWFGRLMVRIAGHG